MLRLNKAGVNRIPMVLAGLCLLLGQYSYAHSDAGPIYDQFTLQANASGDVENDLMVVLLQVNHEDRDATALANKVNTDMAWALEQLKDQQEIEYRTQNYSTYPKYEQNRVIGWRASQTLSLQGSNFDAIKDALLQLQSKLQIQQMAFKPKDETRKAVEDELIGQALENFKRRAIIVQNNMGSGGYRVMQLNINTSDTMMPRSRGNLATMSRSMESAPAVEGGQSKISVNVSGQIQLQ